jgi:RNA polymerase sigma-70 factor (ECF subfamily)
VSEETATLSALEDALRAARAALPGVGELAAEARPSLELALAAGPLTAERAAEIYLCSACLAGDAAALRLLDERYLSALAPFLASIDPCADFSDEVRQQLRTVLLAGASPKLSTFTGHGPLGAFLRVAAVRAGRKLQKRRAPERFELPGDDSLAAAGDPELALLKAHHRGECDSALRAAMAALEPRARALLRLHYIEGMSLDALGPVYRVHRATAARWLAAARAELLSGVRRELAQRLGGASSGAVDSLLQIMRSQLHVSLRDME